MKSKINKQAWKLLREEEQLALSLKVAHSKSTWEAGEVMQRAHYKFLEIEQRAKQFLKMFTEHFIMYDGELIPDYVKIDARVKKYFESAILGRMSAKEASDSVEDSQFKLRSVREEIIVKELSRLSKSDKAINKNIALIVFEFDRWNNWRVLPPSIQEPSAFKRRNKNNDKRNIKNLLNLNEYQIEKITERFQDDEGSLYMPIPCKVGEEGEGIIKVLADKPIVDKLSKLGFFLFTKKVKAEEFYKLVKSYDFFNSKSCIEGQKFWPKYREMIKNSINYNAIGKRIASRKFLQGAMKEIEDDQEENH